jgi:NAD-dependent deacetylase
MLVECPARRANDDVEDELATLRTGLEAARIVAFTGAGISAESGIPTFRGPNGLWRNFSPEKLASPQAFADDPRLVWEWYDWRRQIIHKAQPNPGHRALAEIERRAQERFTLVTQNVDGLHERAGSRNVVKLHGDIWQVRCVSCAAEQRNEQVPMQPLPPHCQCGALLRPAVVWFGEALPEDAWERAYEAATRAQVFLVIGTSALVYPAAGLVQVARQSGARVAIVNPDPTAADPLADWVLRGPAGNLLPRLL